MTGTTDGLTLMRREIEEIPEAVSRLLASSGPALTDAGIAVRAADPVMVATIARGSSDHAATFLKYAIELCAHVPVASLGPSVMSIYGDEVRLAGCAALAISQSGGSPDIVQMTRSAGRAGALTIALTNDPHSPLAEAAERAVDIAAGPERSIAATKSFVNSIVAGLVLLAEWQQDAALRGVLADLPGHLERSLAADWSVLLDAFDGQRSLFVIGRGPALAIASEAALKLKETCAIHAEAYSSAEVIHGPARIVGSGFPVLALAVRDAAEESIAETVDRLAGQGALCFSTTGRAAGAWHLPMVETGHPLTDALALIVPFYCMVEALSRRCGFDPDNPPHLSKVTKTL